MLFLVFSRVIIQPGSRLCSCLCVAFDMMTEYPKLTLLRPPLLCISVFYIFLHETEWTYLLNGHDHWVFFVNYCLHNLHNIFLYLFLIIRVYIGISIICDSNMIKLAAVIMFVPLVMMQEIVFLYSTHNLAAHFSYGSWPAWMSYRTIIMSPSWCDLDEWNGNL